MANPPRDAIPISWTELIEKGRTYLDKACEYAKEGVPWIESSPPRAIDISLRAPANWICRAAVLRGPYACRAALAIGALDHLPAFLHGRPPARFEPGKRFQLDVEKFVWYLAAAQKERAQPADVEPAWLDFVRNFPCKLGTRALEFSQLMLAGR